MSRSTELKVKQLQVVIGCWIVVGFLIAVYDHLLLHTYNSLGPSPGYAFGLSALRNMIAGLLGALLGGSFLVFYVNVRYQDKPYGYTIIAVSVAFLLIVAFITVVLRTILALLRTGEPIYTPAFRSAFYEFIWDPYPVKSGFVCSSW
jgi:adenylate cyclase